MKKVLSGTFTLLGAVIGAGFISGRELCDFFGTDNFFIGLSLSTALFFIFTLRLLNIGYKYGGYENFLNGLPKRISAPYEILMNVGAFILLSGMIAGISGMEGAFTPIVTLVSVISAFFICSVGIKGLNAVNNFSVPFILALTVFALFKENNFFFRGGGVEIGKLFSAFSYSGLNIFLASPVIMDLGKDMKSRKFLLSVVSALFTFLLASLILLSLSANMSSVVKDMPLNDVLSAYPAFKAAVFFGVLTTLYSSYYPLYKGVKSAAAKIAVLIAAYLLSKIGFSNIVGNIYPLLGIAGFCFLTLACLYDKLFRKGD